jgi:hypothetical protein
MRELLPDPLATRSERLGLHAYDLTPPAGGRRLIRYWANDDLSPVVRAESLGVPYALRVEPQHLTTSLIRQLSRASLFRGFVLADGFEVTPALARALKRLPNLVYLGVCGATGRPELLADLPALRTVCFALRRAEDDLSLIGRFSRQDVHIDAFRFCPSHGWPANISNVTSLKAPLAPVGTNIAAVVERQPRLTSLMAESCELTPEAVEGLRGRPMTALAIRCGNLSVRSLRVIAGLTRLRTLELNGGRFGPKAVAELRCLKRLRHLRLSNVDLSGGGAAILAAMPSLESLELRSCGLADADFAHLVGAGKLMWLTLSGDDLDGSGLRLLGPRPSLRGLDVSSSSRFSDAGMAALPNFPNLRHLGLCFTAATDAGAEHFAALPKLQHLWIMYSRLGGAALRHLPRPDRLTTLSVAGRRVGSLLKAAIDLDLAGLAFGRWEWNEPQPDRPTNADVRRVKLPTWHVSATMLRQFRRLPNLEAIVVEPHDLTNRSVRALVATGDVRRMPLFAKEHVDLGSSFLDADGVMMLVPYLANVKRLDVSSRYVAAGDVARIAEALPGCEVRRG